MIKNSIITIIRTLKENRTLQILLLVLFLAAAVILALTFDMNAAQSFIQQNRRQATVISIVVYIMLGFTFFPTTPLTLFLAVLLGPLNAMLIAITGNTLAALIEYQIGATVGDVMDFETKKAKLPFGLGKLPLTSPYLLMAGRMLPLGKRGFSIVCGAYQVPIFRYLWTSMLMYVIDAAIVAYAGAGLIRPFYR